MRRETSESASRHTFVRCTTDGLTQSMMRRSIPSGVSRGWYQDAPDRSQKIGTDVFADVQTVVFAFSKPNSDPCEGLLSSTLYARDFIRAHRLAVREIEPQPIGRDERAGLRNVLSQNLAQSRMQQVRRSVIAHNRPPPIRIDNRPHRLEEETALQNAGDFVLLETDCRLATGDRRVELSPVRSPQSYVVPNLSHFFPRIRNF